MNTLQRPTPDKYAFKIWTKVPTRFDVDPPPVKLGDQTFSLKPVFTAEFASGIP